MMMVLTAVTMAEVAAAAAMTAPMAHLRFVLGPRFSAVLDRTHLRTRTVVLDQTLAFQPLQPVRRLPAPIAA